MASTARLPAHKTLLLPITGYFLLTAPRQRRASRRYLERVLGRSPTWWDVARHIHCFAATILDRVFLLSGRFDQLEIRIHNLEVLLERARDGRGCILLGSHLGSFEVLRALAVKQSDLRVKVLMYPNHNQTITRLLDALDPAVAETVIPLGTPDVLLRLHEALEDHSMVGILGDRVTANDRQVSCRFLGAEARFPAGPVLIAAATGAPVVLFFGLYRGGRRYDVHFELLAERIQIDRQQRMPAAQAWTQRYVERLEFHARAAPYNWFNFYDFWDDTGRSD